MTDFAQLQSDFQRAIVEGDRSVLAKILDSPQQTRDVLFDVYKDAYVLRLIEAMGNDYELLRRYMGDEMFGEMATAYIKRWPSHHPNIRWFGRNLPRFVADEDPYSDYPILKEVSTLENALGDAFDAPDGDILTTTKLSTIDPSQWHELILAPHVATRRFDFATNALEVWTALRDDEEVPEAEVRDTASRIIVWRQEAIAMVRALSTEEAMMWDEAAKGIPFGQLCAMLATYDDPDGAAGRAAAYLGQWVNAGMLADATIG